MTLVADLVTQLGEDKVLSEPLERYLYGTDGGVARGEASVVVLPRTAEEVSAVVKIAQQYDSPIVPRGAGTGLAGGAAPAVPALVISLTRMTDVDIDLDNHTAWVGPGVINLDLSKMTRPAGYHFAPDPSSQSACTIGGNVANNSGGPHCLAEGTTTSHVLAVELVTANGEIVVLGGPAPDPIGLDLRSVVVGSEGLLGVITRALVKLTPNPPAVRTILAAFDTMEDAVATASGVVARGIVPAALEIMDQRMTQAVENFVGAGFPTDAGAVLLAEVAGHPAAVEAEALLVAEVAAENACTMLRVAGDEVERAKWWLGRKSAFGAVAQLAPDYYLHDTVVPRTRLVETVNKVYEIAERHNVNMLNVFHAGDGNLHPLVTFDASVDGQLEVVHAAMEEVVKVCVEAGGALSGEHGIGIEKRDLMPLLYNEADLDAQARLREAFDPTGLFNPEKVLPAGSRCVDLGRPVPTGVWI
ncbi:MAG: FAD-binding protein [Acidimicrobiia bacterium]|nr:FAD-binding protein [Acidimicrobiia bacterium]